MWADDGVHDRVAAAARDAGRDGYADLGRRGPRDPGDLRDGRETLQTDAGEADGISICAIGIHPTTGRQVDSLDRHLDLAEVIGSSVPVAAAIGSAAACQVPVAVDPVDPIERDAVRPAIGLDRDRSLVRLRDRSFDT